MEAEAQKLLAWKLVCIQSLGLIVVAGTGTVALGFCSVHSNHDIDRWPIFLDFILVSIACGIAFFLYRIPPLLMAHFHGGVGHAKSDAFKFLRAIVWIDLVAMVGLVSLTGGLTNSFYTPILVTIPVVAFLIQDEPDYSFTIHVFIATFIGIAIAASINLLHIEGWLTRRWSFTSTSTHSWYGWCLLVVTIVGAGMPFIDVLIRYYSERSGGSSRDPSV